MNAAELSRRLAEVRQGADLGAVIRALYEAPDPGLSARLAALRPPLGDDVGAVLDHARSSLGYGDALLVLTAALDAMPYGRDWVAFDLTLKQQELVKLGFAGLREPTIRQAQSLLDAGGLNDVAQAALRGWLEALSQVPPEPPPPFQAPPGWAPPPGLPGKYWAPDLAPITGPGVDTLTVVPRSVADFRAPAEEDSRHFIFNIRRELRPAITVLSMEDAVVSIDVRRVGLTEFYVFDRGGTLHEPLSRGAQPFLEDTVAVSEVLALGDDIFPEFNVSHFLLDKLSRCGLYDPVASEPYRLLLFGSSPYYHRALSRAGRTALTPERPRMSFRVRRLLASTNVAREFRHPAHFCAPWAIDYLTRTLRREAASPSRRIFISRGDTTGRRILNTAEVDAVLERFGFERHELGSLPLSAQIALLGQATHVVGVHGAGLANILFAPRGARVLEILPPLCGTAAYWMLAQALEQPYAALIAQDPEVPEPPYAQWRHEPSFGARDLIVDPDRLAGRLRQMTEAPVDA
jgi:hypothetical protein